MATRAYRPTNFGYDRFGGTNLDKPQTRTTAAQRANLANTNKYKIGSESRYGLARRNDALAGYKNKNPTELTE